MVHPIQQKSLKLVKNERDILSPSEGGHWHGVGWHIWLVCILELKIFECHSIVFAFQKGYVKLQMVYPMQKNCSNRWRNEQDMPFPSEGGHEHDVSWHIWLVWILELKIFGHHSIVFAFPKGCVKLQMALP
jgi:hypothetical protein